MFKVIDISSNAVKFVGSLAMCEAFKGLHGENEYLRIYKSID